MAIHLARRRWRTDRRRLTILATRIAHDINPRAYLHAVTKLIVYGWPNTHLRDLLPDRILKKHPNLFIGDPLDLPEVPELAMLLLVRTLRPAGTFG